MQAAPGPGNEMQQSFTQAEDAVQEAFLKAYRALPAFRGDSSAKTWLTRIAINVWNVICQG